MAFLLKINKLNNLLKEIGLKKEAEHIYSLYKYAISYEEAINQVLNSKKNEKRIKNYILNLYKTPDVSYQELLMDFDLEIENKIEDEKKYYRDLIAHLVPQDLSDNERGQVVIWLVRIIPIEQVLNRSLNYQLTKESLRKLEIFFHYKEFMSKKDLFEINSLEELVLVTEEAKTKIEEYLKDKEYNDANSGKKLIYDGPEYVVYEVHNKGAACELGKGTDWCTAAPGLDYFEHYYSPDSPLFVFINKSNPKERYQFSYKHRQFMNKNDHPISDYLKQDLTRLISDYLKDNYLTIYLLNLANNEEANKILENQKMSFNLEDIKIINSRFDLSKEAKKQFEGRQEGPDGSVAYFDENFQYHREDGPAYKLKTGFTAWYIHGELHRDDGPALIDPGREEVWYQHGRIHRDDGPALITRNGTEIWYQHGRIHRDDGPAKIDSRGKKMWYQNNLLHRDDGPAVIEPNGRQVWYQKGKRHREDGPAVVRENGRNSWFLNDKRVKPF